VSARLTTAEARALGLSVPEARARTTRKEVTGIPYWSRCHTCDEVFTTVASEDRHLTATHHSRYSVLERNP